MSSYQLIPFHITSIDSLGQGVSKITDKVTFVPKTLPEEKGQALIVAEKSKIAFAHVKKIEQSSSRRVPSPCLHFNQCSGCHYLHTDYPYEIELKLAGMKNLFRHYSDLNHQVIQAPSRLGYRNRMQLHYDLASEKLGLLDINREILEIPSCLIGRPEVSQMIKDLYDQKKWLKLAPTNVKRGHLEVYFHQNELKLSWNRPYSEGGFTQVNAEMNQQLKEKIKEATSNLRPKLVLDLFAGDGNLSDNLQFEKRLCVDMYQKSIPPGFLSLNLYGKHALETVSKKLGGFQVDLLILDPPRSGLKNLKEWLERLKPHHVVYVSCDPHTQIRDILPLTNYQIKESWMLDLFPATFHFETMVILERNN